jgi:hypothetical protein
VDEDAEVAWDAEIARRIGELDEGKVKLAVRPNNPIKLSCAPARPAAYRVR